MSKGYKQKDRQVATPAVQGNDRDTEAAKPLDIVATDTNVIKLSTVPLLRRLPKRFRGGPYESLPEELIGATIVSIGTPKQFGLIEGSGLFIDYRPSGTDCVHRIALAFDEMSMWEVECE